jgi:hypothetical protein
MLRLGPSHVARPNYCCGVVGGSYEANEGTKEKKERKKRKINKNKQK